MRSPRLKETIRKREWILWGIPLLLLALVLLLNFVQGHTSDFFSVLNVCLPTLVGLILMLTIRLKILKDTLEDTFAGATMPEIQELIKTKQKMICRDWQDDRGFLKRTLLEASKRILIVMTWIPPNLDTLRSVLKTLLQNKSIEIHICLCRPESIPCQRRVLDVGRTEKESEDLIRSWHQDRIEILCHGMKAEERPRFYFYDNLPTFPIYLVDNTIVVGFYLVGSEGFENPLLAFDCSDAHSIGGRLRKHAEDILAKATPMGVNTGNAHMKQKGDDE